MHCAAHVITVVVRYHVFDNTLLHYTAAGISIQTDRPLPRVVCVNTDRRTDPLTALPRAVLEETHRRLSR